MTCANFKCVVWHPSFEVLLASIKELKITHEQDVGLHKCGDGVEHLLYPTILILSADYEEQ